MCREVTFSSSWRSCLVRASLEHMVCWGATTVHTHLPSLSWAELYTCQDSSGLAGKTWQWEILQHLNFIVSFIIPDLLALQTHDTRLPKIHLLVPRQTTPTSPPSNQNAAAVHQSHSRAQFCSLFDWQLLERGDLSCSAVSFLNCCRVTDPITVCLEVVRVRDRWRIDEHQLMQVWRILDLHNLHTSGILQHYRFCLLCSLFMLCSIFNLARGTPHRIFVNIQSDINIKIVHESEKDWTMKELHNCVTSTVYLVMKPICSILYSIF